MAGHIPKKCHLLNKKQRPNGWKIGPRHAKGILDALDADEKLKEKHQAAYREITAFLAKNDPNQDKADDSMTDSPVKGAAIAFRPKEKEARASFFYHTYPLRNNTI